MARLFPADPGEEVGRPRREYSSELLGIPNPQPDGQGMKASGIQRCGECPAREREPERVGYAK